MASARAIRDSQFAVVDVETTGLFPRKHDRIVEVAVVTVTADGEVLDEYASLINPGRDLGPVEIHGIRGSDVASAPRFEDIAGDLADRLSGSVVAGHNVRFDVDFLAAEFGRLGVSLPPLPCVCTLRLSDRLALAAASRRLSGCCEALGIQHVAAHTALGDAWATARLLLALLNAAHCDTLERLGCFGVLLQHGAFPGLRRTGLVWRRDAAVEQSEEARGYLGRLVSRLPISSGPADASVTSREATLAYLELLDRALEDRHVTVAEADALIELAEQWGMSSQGVREVHAEYLRALAVAALADGVVSEAERRDLAEVAEWLGLGVSAVDEAVAEGRRTRPDSAAQARVPTCENLAGKSVCFTGAMRCTVDGQPITREMSEQLARSKGLRVASGVSNKLDLLVTADPLSLSGKASKAREHGVRIVAEAVFWRTLGIPVD
jgi:DNA polymerase-3 subunit epsilon